VVKRSIALTSCLLATAFFFVQHNSADGSSVALLRKMESESVPLSTALCSGKPTVVEFFAPWCQSCKETAAGMRALELQYRDQLNFVTIDGANEANSKLVSLFNVDAIPHLTFIGADTAVRTSMVGAVPKEMVRDDIVALLARRELPHVGFDAFAQPASPSSTMLLVADKSVCPATP